MKPNDPHFMTVVDLRSAEDHIRLAREALEGSVHASIYAASYIRAAQEELAHAACKLTSTAQRYAPKLDYDD